MNDLLPAVCAVDDRRLIVAVVNADERCIIENAVVAEHLPDMYNDQNERPVLRLCIPGNRINAKCLKDRVVDKAGFRTQHCEHQIADHNDGDQVRHQDDGLVHLLKELARNLV